MPWPDHISLCHICSDLSVIFERTIMHTEFQYCLRSLFNQTINQILAEPTLRHNGSYL